jgi:hypothetical protein
VACHRDIGVRMAFACLCASKRVSTLTIYWYYTSFGSSGTTPTLPQRVWGTVHWLPIIDHVLRYSGGTSVFTSESADIERVTVIAHNGTRLGTFNLDAD